MLYSPAFTFANGYPLGVLPCAGLRLWVLRWFQAFLAASAYALSASSYHFASTAPLQLRSAFSRVAHVVKLVFPVLASGSNCRIPDDHMAVYGTDASEIGASRPLWPASASCS